MITMLIGWAAKAVGPRFAKPLVYGLMVLAVVAFFWWLRSDAYNDGVNAESGRWEQKIADDKAAQLERERLADQRLQAQRQRDAAAAGERKKEIDNATRNIPDQSPSARQRARACLELRRQAKADGRPQPSC